MASMAAVVAWTGETSGSERLEALAHSAAWKGFAVAASPQEPLKIGGIHRLNATNLRSAAGVTEALRWFETTGASHLLWMLSPRVELSAAGVRRLLQAATDSGAAAVYSDYFDRQTDGSASLHPLIDYQPGSLRDDFDFGQAIVFSRTAVAGLADAIAHDNVAQDFSGWYDLRLRVSERGPILHLSEPAYALHLLDVSTAGEAHFNYVDPKNREYQIETERVATAHLKRIGAWLPPPTTGPVEEDARFPVEASVVIPVRNRVRTVADAVQSALAQKADFAFNVIVVDNHSTDGTTNILAKLAAEDPRLIHLLPERTDLGIGGCWNEAVYSQHGGRYAVQLDSDDLYVDSSVLSRVVAEFRRGNYAMVIGSYTIVDFDLNQIPPGLIDHREWTAENGHNNALRIAGLGAPRAFHVPTLRTIGFPNVSFGEDYAVALRLSRQYPLGRIYESLYWCRRWEGNTDHALPLETRNRYAAYKDRLRSIEIAARQQ
jgi:Glycosyl transferase family 2